MEKNHLKKLISDNQEYISKVEVIPRELPFEYSAVKQLNKIFTVSGPRRAGKTFFLFQVMRELKLKKNEIVFLDFSEMHFVEFRPRHFENVLDAYLELFPESTPMFFFDEIQEVRDFESGLKFLFNRGYKVFITGSSAKLFTRDIASSLRGKTYPVDVYPLNFREFLRFKGFSQENRHSSKEHARLSRLLEEFLTWGGFPEVVLGGSPEVKTNLLKSYVDIMLFRDIVERHGIKNIFLVESLFYKLVRSFTKNFSVNKWYNEYKSMGLKVSRDTLFQYLKHFEESGFFYFPENCYGGATSLKKVYLVDNGLYQRAIKNSGDTGKLLENQVFRDCLPENNRIRFLQTEKMEADFLLNDRVLQVCSTLNDANFKRETDGIQAALAMENIRKGILVVIDDEREKTRGEVIDGISIFHYPDVVSLRGLYSEQCSLKN